MTLVTDCSTVLLVRGPQRGCNLIRLACNPCVIFVILILILLIQIRNL